jgi:hypothetical protein
MSTLTLNEEGLVMNKNIGTIRFEIAGKPRGENERVFLTSKNRVRKQNNVIYHRNDYHTTITMTKEYFNNNFNFNFSTWIYETDLKWKDLKENTIIETVHLN